MKVTNKTITLTPANAHLYATLNDTAKAKISEVLDMSVIDDKVISITLEQIQLPYNEAIDYRCSHIDVLTEDEAEDEEAVYYNPLALIRAFGLDTVDA